MSWAYTGTFRAFESQNLKGGTSGGYINVYFVKELGDMKAYDDNMSHLPEWDVNRGRLDGVTFNSITLAPQRLTVLLADSADATTLAHEFGDVMGLQHVTKPEDVDGDLGGRAANAGAGAGVILADDLMWSGTPPRSGTLLMPSQSKYAQDQLELMNSTKVGGNPMLYITRD